jgi:putative SOS response-associated peptidase YedK
MCGRFYLDVTFEELLTRYDLRRLEADYAPRSEIFPTDPILAITQKAQDRFTAIQWGIQQPYLKQVLINARVESLFEKAMFKNLVLLNKCIIPASGYYEWQTLGKTKVKHRIHLGEDKLLSLAGLYGIYSFQGVQKVMSVILTREASEALQPIHTRMPLVLTKEEEKQYLLVEDSKSIIALLSEYKAPALIAEVC